MQKTYQMRSVPYLDRLGFLSARVIAAHVVHVNDAEIEILRDRNVGVGHCPQSNMKLASGVAPVPTMLKKNVRLGLGTDGAASNNDLNMWEEMDSAAKLHKLISKDPTVVSAREALSMATIGGARAIHLEKEIGSLEVGKKADMILVDLSGAHTTPLYNLYSHLVYAAKASDVTDTIVNGRILMRDRRLLTLDELAIKAKARLRRDQVAKSLK
jgi:5-methylthioadenosine/S-adenosylhomocysteine deaminase